MPVIIVGEPYKHHTSNVGLKSRTLQLDTNIPPQPRN